MRKEIELKKCATCGSSAVSVLRDFGPQPISNRYLRHPKDADYSHSMIFCGCSNCSTLQLIDPVPAEMLRPIYDWIFYSEPEDHLDALALTISRLPNLTPDSVICGITSKDDTLLDRLKKLGFKNVWRLDPESDLGTGPGNIGMETVQDRLTPELSLGLARQYGRSDVVLARHIVEHTHQTREFLVALENLAAPGGYLVLETPDCTRALKELDYTVLWEEHTRYYTPGTFQQVLHLAGFNVPHFENVAYSMENVLVAVAQTPAQGESLSGSSPALLKEFIDDFQIGVTFAEGLELKRQSVIGKLMPLKQNGKLAMWGAGHLACTFVILFQLEGIIDFFIDDHPEKKNLFMPGSKLPIYGSEALTANPVSACLLSFNPRNMETFLHKNRAFLVDQKGKFLSIFDSF